MITRFPWRSPRRTMSVHRGNRSACGLVQIAEEIAIGVQHHHVTLVGEAFAVRLEAAVEGVELLILTEGLGVDGGGPGVAITTGFFGFAIGFGQQYAALTVGIGTNTFG